MVRKCPKCGGTIWRLGKKEKPFYCNWCKEKFTKDEVLVESITNEDVVSVIRCRDCMYYSAGQNDSEKWEYCTSWFADTFSNGYCWKGEKSR